MRWGDGECADASRYRWFFFFFFLDSIERDVEMNKDCCKSCKI